MKKYYKTIIPALLFICVFTASYGQWPGDNATWYPMGTGMGGGQYFVHSLSVCDTGYPSPILIFAGGNFDSAGGISAKHIAKWNGTGWSGMGRGTNGEVDAITIFNHKVYAAGIFDSAGGVLAHYIANCDTNNNWDSVLGGLNGNVYALKVFNGALYAGGSFTMANGIKAHRIAKWDGTKWDSVGAGFDSNTVYALEVYNDTLYAGGSFTKSAGQTVNYIAKWNGTMWITVGGGMNNTVYALDSSVTLPTNIFPVPGLYAGGAFTQAGGINANYIAVIDTNGQRWDSLGSGTNDTVRALSQGNIIPAAMEKQNRVLSPTQPFLMVGGKFTRTGNLPSPYIGFWDGAKWDTNGAFVNKPVYAVASENQYIQANDFVGGMFDTSYHHHVGGFKVNYVAMLQVFDCCGFNELSDNSSISIYPNPSNGVFTIEVKSGKVKGESVVEIYNEIGQKVYSAPFNIQNSTFNISGQPAGIYLCRVIANDGKVIGSSKIVVK